MIREIPPPQYLETSEEVLAKLREASTGGFLAVDTETTGLDIIRDHIVLWSFANTEARYATKAYTLDALKQFLEEDSSTILIFHNAAYDIHLLTNAGFDPMKLWARCFDTQMMSNLWDPDGFHDLKGLSWKILGVPPKKFRQYNFSKMKLEDVTGEDFVQLVDYAAKDAWLTIMIFHVIFKDLYEAEAYTTGKKCTLWDYYITMERPLAPILWRMERRGMRLDREYLEGLLAPMQERLRKITEQFSRYAGRVVNMKSHPQLRYALFEVLGYSVVGKTDTGLPSTDAESLSTLLDQEQNLNDPVLELIQEYRGVDKFRGTYVKGPLERMIEDVIHTHFNQHVTATGRLSSSDPNLQNIPRSDKDKHGFHIRRAFVAREGYKLIAADYAQIEMRVLAHLAQAKTLLEPILQGMDMHSLTASRMFNVPYEDIVAAKKKPKGDVTERDEQLLKYRSVAKTINFGVLYGLTAYGLVKNLKKDAGMIVSKREAQKYLDAYWDVHYDVREFFDDCVDFSKEQGFIPTYFGRKRYVYWPKSRKQWSAIAEAQRRTYNTPIQGTAAEIMKLAMVKMDADEELRKLGAEMLLQVHDEIIIEVPAEHAARALELVRADMEHPGIELDVPLTVDAAVADNWEEGK